MVVGSGNWSDKLREFDHDYVNVVGPVDRDLVSDYFKCSDVFVYPTRSDRLPNVILEAIATQTPIIATPIGEIPDVVKEGITDPEDFVERILKDDLRTEQEPEWFDWNFQNREYQTYFNEILKKHNS